VPPFSDFAVPRFAMASALLPSLLPPVLAPMVKVSPFAGVPLIVALTFVP